MKHRVDGPLMGECQLVRHWGHHLGYWKGAVTSESQLYRPIGEVLAAAFSAFVA